MNQKLTKFFVCLTFLLNAITYAADPLKEGFLVPSEISSNNPEV